MLKYLQNLRKRNEGFTIIEVLIVLAIAGLIMVIIFIAVPALQRAQRNEARNNDARLITNTINECLVNRNGVREACDNTPTGEVVFPPARFLTNATHGAGPGNTDTATWQFGFRCSPDGRAAESATTREFVVRYQVETANPRITAERCISG